MYKMKAIKNKDLVVKGFNYCLGDIIQGTNDCYIMDERGIEIIPGKYDLVEVFGTTGKQIIKDLEAS